MFGASGKAEPPPPPLLHLLLVGLFYHLATAQGTAPCYECDEFKEIHPNYSPAEEVSRELFPFLLLVKNEVQKTDGADLLAVFAGYLRLFCFELKFFLLFSKTLHEK
jgi:hypothetical protein